MNAKWKYSLCTTFSFFELSHECATIINLCEVTETFENQDFKQRIWLIKREKCKRPSVQYVLFDIIAQVPSKSFGIRHIVSIDTCTQFYCVFHLFNRIFYFSHSSALVYSQGKFRCVYRRKADQFGSWKTLISLSAEPTNSSCLILEQQTILKQAGGIMHKILSFERFSTFMFIDLSSKKRLIVFNPRINNRGRYFKRMLLLSFINH